MKTSKTLLGASAIAFIVSSFSVILILMEISDIVSGIVFWVGLLGGILFYMFALKSLPEKTKRYKIPAIFRYFSNKQAIVIDSIMFISLFITIYFTVNYRSNQTIAAVILFLLILNVYGHFLVNGKVYKYIKKNKKGGNVNDKLKNTVER